MVIERNKRYFRFHHYQPNLSTPEQDIIDHSGIETGDWILFKSFPDEDSALELQQTLKQHGIASGISNNLTALDEIYVRNTLNYRFFLHLKKPDLVNAQQIVTAQAEQIIKDLPDDYYLFTFEDDELMEILRKPDEWSDLDAQLAQNLLRKRGIGMDQEQVEEFHKSRMAELKKPDKRQIALIVVGYCLAITGPFLALFPTALGIFIGWHLFSHKKLIPTGEKVYAYIPEDRKQGRIIFILGCSLLGIVGTIIILMGRMPIEFLL